MVRFRELKSWGSSTEVVESLVNDLDCVSRKVIYPELLVFSYAVFNSEQIKMCVRKLVLIIICDKFFFKYLKIINSFICILDTALVENTNALNSAIITK